MTSYLIASTISIIIATGALTALAVDRSGRAQAWRRIADERRWNHDSRRQDVS
jgi:hypothetical protein